MSGTALVIEDNDLLRKALRISLESAGIDVEEAASGAEALASVRDSAPDLVITDLGLPDTDGVELAGKIRASGGAELPMVALSGAVEGLARAREAGAGFTACLLKPVSPDELIALAARLLGSGGVTVAEAG